MTELLRTSRLRNLMDSSLFKDKISLEKISVTILSSRSIGFLFYFNTGTLKFSYPFVVILIFLISFTLFIYISNRNLSNSIKANYEIISCSLWEKFQFVSHLASKDKYGLMAYDLIQIVIALRRTVESLIKIISEITIYSKQNEDFKKIFQNSIEMSS